MSSCVWRGRGRSRRNLGSGGWHPPVRQVTIDLKAHGAWSARLKIERVLARSSPYTVSDRRFGISFAFEDQSSLLNSTTPLRADSHSSISSPLIVRRSGPATRTRSVPILSTVAPLSDNCRLPTTSRSRLIREPLDCVAGEDKESTPRVRAETRLKRLLHQVPATDKKKH